MTKILEHTQESTWIGLKKDQLADSKYQTAFRYHKALKIRNFNQIEYLISIKHAIYLLDSTVWKWTDGSTLKDGDYSYWTPGEPNSKDDQQFCAQMWYHGDAAHDGQWDDTKCPNTYRFICHKPRGNTF